MLKKLGSCSMDIVKDGRTNVRYLILAMLFIVTMFNYVDRATLSIAASTIQKELKFDAVMMGYAFSAFSWAYTAFQIPGGWALDKYGARLIYGLGLFLWSLFTFLQGFSALFTAAFAFLFALRFLMGIAEAPAFPANSRLTAMWFPTKERGLASAIFNSAQYLALAVFTPIMSWILVKFGWHHIFFWMGIAGIIISLIWFKVIRDPQHHPRANKAELEYIQAGGGLVTMGDKRSEIKWDYVKQMLSNRLIVGVYIGQFCLNSITWFFLTWFPTYLVQAKHMSMLKVGFVASIPALAGFCGGILGGFWSDWLLRRGKSLTVARKTPIILGLVFSSSIIIANYVPNNALVIAVMSLAFFSKGIGALGWCVVSDTSPKEMVGLSGGLFNFFGNIAGIVTPIVIGYILHSSGSFNGALFYVGIMGFLGAISYLIIVPSIKRVELKK
jgi:MFS transporter, ACS family, glucarate transporter